MSPVSPTERARSATQAFWSSTDWRTYKDTAHLSSVLYRHTHQDDLEVLWAVFVAVASWKVVSEWKERHPNQKVEQTLWLVLKPEQWKSVSRNVWGATFEVRRQRSTGSLLPPVLTNIFFPHTRCWVKKPCSRRSTPISAGSCSSSRLGTSPGHLPGQDPQSGGAGRCLPCGRGPRVTARLLGPTKANSTAQRL